MRTYSFITWFHVLEHERMFGKSEWQFEEKNGELHFSKKMEFFIETRPHIPNPFEPVKLKYTCSDPRISELQVDPALYMYN